MSIGEPRSPGSSVHEQPCGATREELIGTDPAMQAVMTTVAQVADTDATVLVTGETGTGKELIARELHLRSARRAGPFVAVNCAALASTLLDAEMFGHLRGAFTGATQTRPGKFEAAERGTIFLDEVGEMEPHLQSKLLRVLQTGDYSPVGSATSRRCDVRVVAATNQPLRPMIAAGRFRADLYYRLNVVCLTLPPLRGRRGDILALAEHFLSRFAADYRRGPLHLGADARRILLSHHYPGNVRELENAILRAVILSRAPELCAADLPAEMREPEVPVAAAMTPIPSGGFHAERARILDAFERSFLAQTLELHRGVVSRAAQSVGLSERIFHVKLRKHGLSARSYRACPPPPAAGS